MNHRHAFIEKPDGSYDVTPPGLMLLLAREIHTTPPTALRTKLEEHLRTFLRAATAGGYRQVEVLETLLSRGETSKRVLTMCVEACDAAGNERVAVVMESIR